MATFRVCFVWARYRRFPEYFKHKSPTTRFDRKQSYVSLFGALYLHEREGVLTEKKMKFWAVEIAGDGSEKVLCWPSQ